MAMSSWRRLTKARKRTSFGQPTIIIINIDDGRSARGINQFHKDAKPDGLMIAAIATVTFFQYILKDVDARNERMTAKAREGSSTWTGCPHSSKRSN
jgi:hypothetical protein